MKVIVHKVVLMVLSSKLIATNEKGFAFVWEFEKLMFTI
jgi:hypothetical protein